LIKRSKKRSYGSVISITTAASRSSYIWWTWTGTRDRLPNLKEGNQYNLVLIRKAILRSPTHNGNRPQQLSQKSSLAFGKRTASFRFAVEMATCCY
jgi:hypothetical protein